MTNPTILALEAFPSQLRSLYEAFPSDTKHWTPSSWEGIPSEALTAIEQVCHVRDIEVEGYQVRVRRTLSEQAPVLPSLDTDAMARDRRYAEQDAMAVLKDFEEARAITLQMIQSCSPEQMERPAQFEGYGSVTLRGLMHFLCSHDQQHLAGMQWLLGKLAARKPNFM